MFSIHYELVQWYGGGFCFYASCRARKILESKGLADEERMDALENQLKEARFMAEEADKKYDEVTCSPPAWWINST